MDTIHGFDYFRLRFNRDNELANQQEFNAFSARAGAATDAILIAHGFRNDEEDATGWYSNFLGNFAKNVASAGFAGTLSPRRWVVGGVYWPSKSLPEGPSDGAGQTQSLEGDEEGQIAFLQAQLEDLREEVRDAEKPRIDSAIALLSELNGSTEARDEFVDNLLSAIDGESIDPNEGLEFLRSKSGSEVLDRLSTRKRRRAKPGAGESEGGAIAVGSARAADPEAGEVQGLGTFFGGILGKAGRVVNLATWYIMKERSGAVGAAGVAKAVRDLKAAHPALKVHLVGHSLGGRLMAACAKSLAASPMVQPDSVTLLQAAFSHYGFSKATASRGEGFFRTVVEKKVVKGPLVATFSNLDEVVGRVYSVASMLAGDNTKKFGDKDSQFGGIGCNGCQETEEAAVEKLHRAGSPYTSLNQPGRVLCLDGSKNLIRSHGDITNPDVTYAFASAVSLT